MRKLIFSAVAIMIAAPAFAAGLTMDSELGRSMDEVKASLTSMGYEVRKAEMEDGKIEVYFVKGTTLGEVYVNGETGKIIKLEMK